MINGEAPRIAGVVPVLAAAFDQNGAPDPTGFEGIVNHVFGTGVSAAMLFGLATEFYKLTENEQNTMASAFVEGADRHGAIPILSVTDHATEVAISRARSWERMGAQALNVLPPFFLAPGEAAIRDHLAAILGAVEIPVIVQYAPGQTGTSISPATLAGLAEQHPNLTHVKVESVPPGRYIQQVVDLGLQALVGHAGVQLPDAAERGAVGVQPGCSAVEVYQHIWESWEQGDPTTMRQRHAALLPHISYWMQSVELIIQIEKTILMRRGIIASDHCRAPHWHLDDTDRQHIDRFFSEFGDLVGSGQTASDDRNG